jgi:hypothetical protein
VPRGARAEETDALPVIDLAADEAAAGASPRPVATAPRTRGLRPRHWLPFLAAGVVLVVVASLLQQGSSHSSTTTASSTATTSATTLPAVPPDHDAAGALFPGVAPAIGTLVVGGRYGLRHADLATGRVTKWQPSGLPVGPTAIVATNGTTTVVRATSLSGGVLWAVDGDSAAAVTGEAAFVGPDGSIWTWHAPLARRLGATTSPNDSVTLPQYALDAVVAGGFVVDSLGASNGLQLVTAAHGVHVVRTLAPPGALLVAEHPHRIAWAQSDCSPPACVLHVTDVDTGADHTVARLTQPPAVSSGAFSADASLLAVPDGVGVDVIDTRSGVTEHFVTDMTTSDGPAISIVGTTVITGYGPDALFAYDTKRGSGVITSATFADRSSLALTLPAPKWVAAARVGNIAVPPIFGRVTGLTAITSDGTVIDLDSGATHHLDADQIGNPGDLVALGAGALAYLPDTRRVVYVDTRGQLRPLGSGDGVIGRDDAHAWIVHNESDGTVTYVPVAPGSLALGPPAHADAQAGAAAGASLAFQEQPAFDQPPVLALWDPAANTRRRVTLPAGSVVGEVNTQFAIATSGYGPCDDGDSCTLTTDVVDLETGATRTSTGPAVPQVLLEPVGSRVVEISNTRIELVDLRTQRVLSTFTRTSTDGQVAPSWSANGWLLVHKLDGDVLVSPDNTVLHASALALGEGSFVLVPTQ